MDQGREINVASDGSWSYGIRDRSMRGKMKVLIIDNTVYLIIISLYII